MSSSRPVLNADQIANAQSMIQQYINEHPGNVHDINFQSEIRRNIAQALNVNSLLLYRVVRDYINEYTPEPPRPVSVALQAKPARCAYRYLTDDQVAKAELLVQEYIDEHPDADFTNGMVLANIRVTIGNKLNVSSIHLVKVVNNYIKAHVNIAPIPKPVESDTSEPKPVRRVRQHQPRPPSQPEPERPMTYADMCNRLALEVVNGTSSDIEESNEESSDEPNEEPVSKPSRGTSCRYKYDPSSGTCRSICEPSRGTVSDDSSDEPNSDNTDPSSDPVDGASSDPKSDPTNETSSDSSEDSTSINTAHAIHRHPYLFIILLFVMLVLYPFMTTSSDLH